MAKLGGAKPAIVLLDCVMTRSEASAEIDKDLEWMEKMNEIQIEDSVVSAECVDNNPHTIRPADRTYFPDNWFILFLYIHVYLVFHSLYLVSLIDSNGFPLLSKSDS